MLMPMRPVGAVATFAGQHTYLMQLICICVSEGAGSTALIVEYLCPQPLMHYPFSGLLITLPHKGAGQTSTECLWRG